MENKRTLTKTGAILGIVAWSINILSLIFTGFFLLIAIDILIDINGSLPTSALSSIIKHVVAFVISIILIVYSAKSIKIANKDLPSFMKKKQTILFVAIVNLLNVCYNVFDLIDLFSKNREINDTNTLILVASSIIVCLLLLVAGILMLVDVSKATKELNTLQTTPAVEETTEQKQIQEEPVEDKLAKLNKMKEDGLISQEEYEKLKSEMLK